MEPGSFEQNGRWLDQTLERSFCAARAVLQRFFDDPLFDLERLLALVAFVNVSGHGERVASSMAATQNRGWNHPLAMHCGRMTLS